MTYEILTYILGGLTIGTALMVILSKHPLRSVLYLVVTFFLISGHFLLMNAQFIAIVNVIVYAGAIMVLFLFVLMLLNLDKDNEPKTPWLTKFIAVISGGALFTVIIAATSESFMHLSQKAAEKTGDAIVKVSDQEGLVENLGHLLFTEYIVPFEVSSILFLASMVGAVLLAKREKQTIVEL
jgi:NADH-quinone oxidoreductase subunit J